MYNRAHAINDCRKTFEDRGNYDVKYLFQGCQFREKLDQIGGYCSQIRQIWDFSTSVVALINTFWLLESIIY